MNNQHKSKIINKLTSVQMEHTPFTYGVIDDFLPQDLAQKLAAEFPNFDDEVWFNYKNKIEDKKLLSDWRKFPEETYQMFSFLNSNLVLETLSSLIGVPLYADNGLHGGGWHIHANGGKLNPHLDYSMHPHLKLQRKLNLIIYLADNWQEDYGGHFGLWNYDAENDTAGALHSELPVKFNRAVLFDTTQNSWHGLSRQVSCPENMYRKSMAIYYLTNPPAGTDTRSRALFAPTEEQKQDDSVLDLIKKRSDFNQSKNVYTQG